MPMLRGSETALPARWCAVTRNMLDNARHVARSGNSTERRWWYDWLFTNHRGVSASWINHHMGLYLMILMMGDNTVTITLLLTNRQEFVSIRVPRNTIVMWYDGYVPERRFLQWSQERISCHNKTCFPTSTAISVCHAWIIPRNHTRHHVSRL